MVVYLLFAVWMEDVPEIREGIRFMISQMPGFGAGLSMAKQEQIRGMKEDAPDMAIVDIVLSERSGAECIRRLQGAGPTMKCLVFSIYEDDQPLEMFAAPLVPLCPYEKQLNKPPCKGFHRNSDACPFGPSSHWHLI